MHSSRSSTALSDETRPLLSRDADDTQEIKYTPLPKIQLSILCYLRLLDPLNFSQIFPYVNQFMANLHPTADPSQIGYYSGLVESAFAMGQLLAIYPWASISDRVGRRPVILAGATGIALTTLAFGLSRNFTSVMISRTLAGLFSGNVAVIPSMLCEITDSTNQSLAFPFFGLWWPIGSILGPLIGGSLSDPAEKYRGLFNAEIFRTFPYFLPCFVVSMINFFGLISSYFFLDETLEKKTPAQSTSIEHSPSVKALLSIPIIRALCASGCCLSFISTAYEVVFVLFCYSPIERGGLSLSVSEIGYSLAISGTITALLQVCFMPALLRRYDNAKLYNFCMAIWPFTFMTLPILNIIAKKGLDSATGKADCLSLFILWNAIALNQFMARIGSLGYSINILLIKGITSSRSALGATTGLLQFCICLSRAFSPAFVSSLFAISMKRNILWGNLWVVVMVSLSAAGNVFSSKVVKERTRLEYVEAEACLNSRGEQCNDCR